MVLKQPIQDILTALAAIQSNSLPLFNTVRVWNNQLKLEESAKTYDFLKPAAFVEVISPAEFNELGIGMQQVDLGIKIHIIHEWLDNQDGNFEQDLAVFDLRDQVVKSISFFQPSGCNEMIKKSEYMDYDHGNQYHYIIDFITGFIDSTMYDQKQTGYTQSVPPTALQLNVTEQAAVEDPTLMGSDYNLPNDGTYIIPQK